MFIRSISIHKILKHEKNKTIAKFNKVYPNKKEKYKALESVCPNLHLLGHEVEAGRRASRFSPIDGGDIRAWNRRYRNKIDLRIFLNRCYKLSPNYFNFVSFLVIFKNMKNIY